MTLKEIVYESAKKIIESINPGIKSISGIGDGTIKGAISFLNDENNKTSNYIRHSISITGSDNSVAYAHENEVSKAVYFTCKVKIISRIAAGTRFAWLPTPKEYTCFNLVGYGADKTDIINISITIGTDGVAITRNEIPAGYVIIGSCSYISK